MKILNTDDEPLINIPYLNAGRKPNNFFVDRLPVYRAVVDMLPSGIDAIVVTADLQGRETFAKGTSNGQLRLLGEILPTELDPVLDSLGVNSSLNVGAILAGDFYTYPDLHGRGGTGDVTNVWKTFVDQYKWVVGVAGNHDTFGERNRPPRNHSRMHFLDETRIELEGLQVAGLSGVIGNPRKNFRRDHFSFLESLEFILEDPTDILVMHDGPDADTPGCRGITEAREIIQRKNPSLVIRGHKHWPQPLATLPNGTQILNVEATVVILVDGR